MASNCRRIEKAAFSESRRTPGSADLRVCERADQCDKLNSDGEPCLHGTPHKWNQGCEIGCMIKRPFGATCVCLPNDQVEARL